MNRRGFLGSILAACAAPAIVRADSLMRIVPMETTVLSAMEFPSAAEIGNRLLTINQITREALLILEGEMDFGADFLSAMKDYYTPGHTIKIRRPARFAA